MFYSNTMHDLGGGGIFCMDTHGHTSYNNSLWNVTTGIEVVSNCVDARIYNNSVRNASTGLNISGKGAEVYENLASESNVGFAIDFPSTDSWINVHDNIAHSNTQAGFWLTEGGSPDQSYPFQNNVAWNNSLAGFLIAPKGDFPIMSENIARNNTIGVYFNGGTGGNFTDCESYENRLGVVFSGEKGSVYNCDIYDNTDNAPLGGTGTGVVFQESQENEVANSRIDGNNIGVFINKSTLDTLNGCNIFENSREAIWITRYAFSTRIVNTDSHDNEGATPPNGLYLVAGGGYPNLTMRNVRIFRNAGVALKMRDFTPSGDGDPAFILEDSIIYGGMQIISGDSGEITNTYFKNDPRGYYLSINEGGVPATQAIVGTNLGIGLPNSEAALGVGADTTRYAYIIYPAISLTKVTLQDATMGTNFASLNASGDAAEMNEDAEVHLRPNTCANLRYYFLDGYPTTFNEIVTNGAEFTPAASTCVGGWATFSVDHFTGYAAEGSAPPEEGGGEFECITAADCSPCEICYNHECILPQGACNIAADCPQSRAYNLQFLCENCACIPIECMEDSDCDEGYTCEENYCIPPECLSDSDCGENEICVNFECTGKGGAGEEKPGTGEAGEPGGPVTPPKPEEKPPFVVPVEIGESVIPLVEPGPEEKKEEWGIWQTVATAAAFAIAMLVLASLIYFLAAKKKKKKRKAEELE
ncbi:MAG: right-handed parallel beta-helix repeat-containing protein [Candidatus Bilamarchaeaceae archaeon]